MSEKKVRVPVVVWLDKLSDTISLFNNKVKDSCVVREVSYEDTFAIKDYDKYEQLMVKKGSRVFVEVEK